MICIHVLVQVHTSFFKPVLPPVPPSRVVLICGPLTRTSTSLSLAHDSDLRNLSNPQEYGYGILQTLVRYTKKHSTVGLSDNHPKFRSLLKNKFFLTIRACMHAKHHRFCLHVCISACSLSAANALIVNDMTKTSK